MLFWIWLQGCKVIHYIINWRVGWSWPWVKRFLESAPGLIITGFVRPDVQIISSKWNDDVPVHIGPKYNLRKTKLERRIISFSNQMYHLHLLTERSWQYALSLVSFLFQSTLLDSAFPCSLSSSFASALGPSLNLFLAIEYGDCHCLYRVFTKDCDE